MHLNAWNHHRAIVLSSYARQPGHYMERGKGGGQEGKRNMSTVVKTQKRVNNIIKRREEREGEDTAKEKK